MKTKLVSLIILFTLILSACAITPAPAEEQAVEEPAEEASVEEPAEPVHLSVAVLPILDALPMHVALEQGYFADQNWT